MLTENDIEKLILFRLIEFRLGGTLYTNTDLREKQKQQLAKFGLIEKEELPSKDGIGFGFEKLPFITQEWIDKPDIGFIRTEGNEVVKRLRNEIDMKNELAKKFYKQWMIADASIEEINILFQDQEIKIEIDDVFDCPDFIKVSIILKDVNKYRIDRITNSVVTSDNQDKRLCRQYHKLGVIKDDFYLIYKNGIYFLIIFIPWLTGWFIQVECKKIEILAEKMEYEA